MEVFIGKDLLGGIPKISDVDENQRPLIVGNDFHNLKRIKNIKLSHVATSVLQRLKKIAESSKI